MAVSPGLHAGERRLRYGFNVAISAIVATAILVFAILIAREYRGQLDWTSSGINSLSPRTQQLLAGVETPLSITALYSVPLAEDVEPVYQRRRDTINDLLDLYAAAGNVSVEVIDPLRDQLAVTTLLTNLREMSAYAEEAQPHKDFIQRFEAFNATMQTTIENIVMRCIETAEQNPNLNRDSEFGVVVIGLRNVAQASQSVAKILTDIQATEQPRYGEAAETITTTVAQMRGLVETARDWFNNQANRGNALPPEATAFFAEAGQQCAPIAEQLATFSTEGGELGEVELDKLLAEITDLVNRPAVLVRTDQKAEIVGFDDVWPFPLDPQAPRGEGPDPDRDFAGEQAISSAILRLTQTERVGLVFVRFGGQPLLQPDFSNFNPMMGRMPEAPYQQMRSELENENFVVEEWDVKAAPTAPSLANVAQTVYVVFPPSPPQQTNPMQPPAEPGINDSQKQAIYDAIDASGMGIFLAGWQPPRNQFGLSEPYAYTEYLESKWGIKVEASHVLVRFAVSPQDENLWMPADPRTATLMSTRADLVLSDHPISRPLRALTAGFPTAAPLTLVTGDGAPEGVTHTPLVEINETERIWGVADVRQLQNDLQTNFGTSPKADDIKTPVTIAYVAEKTVGQQTEESESEDNAAQTKPQRLAVFASEQFASDDVALAMSIGMQGNALVTFQAYPANRDLLLNTLHWLTGDAARIAIGPQRGGVPTLDKLTAGPTVDFLKAFTVGIWPALALVAGGIVWLFRRS